MEKHQFPGRVNQKKIYAFLPDVPGLSSSEELSCEEVEESSSLSAHAGQISGGNQNSGFGSSRVEVWKSAWVGVSASICEHMRGYVTETASVRVSASICENGNLPTLAFGSLFFGPTCCYSWWIQRFSGTIRDHSCKNKKKKLDKDRAIEITKGNVHLLLLCLTRVHLRWCHLF